MKRREFAQSAIYAPLTAAGAEAGNNQSTLQEIATRFFHSLEDFTTEERSQQIVECSNKICVEEDIPEETTGELIEKSSELPDQIRRIRFAIQILKEYNITSTLDESMVQQAGNNAQKITNFIPLIGSLNNLQAAACNISSEPSPKEIERFLYACIAFGLEVGLWYSTAPYQMAWRGTRFVSNRTFLRYARHGCANCVALIMSELHWAL